MTKCKRENDGACVRENREKSQQFNGIYNFCLSNLYVKTYGECTVLKPPLRRSWWLNNHPVNCTAERCCLFIYECLRMSHQHVVSFYIPKETDRFLGTACISSDSLAHRRPLSWLLPPEVAPIWNNCFTPRTNRESKTSDASFIVLYSDN